MANCARSFFHGGRGAGTRGVSLPSATAPETIGLETSWRKVGNCRVHFVAIVELVCGFQSRIRFLALAISKGVRERAIEAI